MYGKINPILIFLFIIGLPFAYSINPIGLPQFSYDAEKGTASVILTIESTSLKENGLLELQMYQGFPSQAILGNPTTCDPLKPYQKAVPYAFDQIGERLTITIANINIPDGTYYPMLVHVDKCCIGSCNARQPYGWGYPLTSDKIIFKKQGSICAQVITKACNPSTKEIRDFSNSCLPSEFTTDLSLCQQVLISKKLQMSNIRRIINYNELPSKTDSFLDYTRAFTGVGEIFAITIQNIGNQPIAPTLEAFFISKDNPFARNREQGLCAVPLQSAFGISGITKEKEQTCKGENGVRYSLSTILPTELPKTYLFFVPYPSRPQPGIPEETLAGSPNYNKDSQYFLDVVLVDNCADKNIFDEIGGTLNYAFNGGTRQCNNLVEPTSPGNTLPSSEAKNSPIQPNSKQKTISRFKLKDTTSKDLLKSQCFTNDMCDDSSANCITIQSLIESGDYPETKAAKDLNEQKSLLSSLSGGEALGGLVGLVAGTGVPAIANIPAITGLCLGGAAATAGALVPACLGILTLGGTVIIGSLTKNIAAFFDLHSQEQKKIKELGYCVPKEESEEFTFKGVTGTIGKSVNEFFGTKGKIKDFTLGIIVIGFLFFLFFYNKSK